MLDEIFEVLLYLIIIPELAIISILIFAGIMIYIFIKTGEYVYLFAGLIVSLMWAIEAYYRIKKKKSFWAD